MTSRKKIILLSLLVLSVVLILTSLYTKYRKNSLEIDFKNSDFPYYFIAIHNEPYYGPNAKGSVQNAYPYLQKMIAKADEYNIKLTLMLSPAWADYISTDPMRLEELKRWQANGHEIAAHHHGIFHGNWDGYSGFSENEAITIRQTKTDIVEQYLGNLEDYMAKLKQINPEINSGCVNEEQSKKEMPNEIIYSTCSGFSNHLKPGTVENDTAPEKGINKFISVGEYNNIERKWLAHFQITTTERESQAETIIKKMNKNEVFGAITHSGIESQYNSFIAYLKFIHQNDPSGQKSKTLTSIIKNELLPEKKIDDQLLIDKKLNSTNKQANGKCGDNICDQLEKNDLNLCPKDCASLEYTQGNEQTTRNKKCGDNICDEMEKKNPDLCPNDCSKNK